MKICADAKNILEILKRHTDIVVTMHANPDGDAVGSALGLAWFLRESLRKNVCIYNESDFPNWLSFLPVPCAYVTDFLEIPFSAPLVVMLDAGEMQRFGEKFPPYLDRKSVG